MKKLFAILICLCLTLVPLNVTASGSSSIGTIVANSTVQPESEFTPESNPTDTSDEQNGAQTNIPIEENSEIIETPIDDGGITITPTPSSPEEQAIQKIIAHKRALGEEIPVETDASAPQLISGGVYNIKNYFSGKYLNVHYGVDANGTNVYQWTKDGSTEQKFKVVEDKTNNCYKIYAMCSSNGNNRVLDVVHNGNGIASGQNVDIWTPIDPEAQNLRLTYLIDGIYHIHMLLNKNLYFTTTDSSNGTGSGKSATSTGNVFIQTYDVNDNQQWKFEYLYSDASTYGGIDTVNKNAIRGWAWNSTDPDNPVNVNIKVIGENLTTYVDTIVTANEFHSASYNLGYGNGYHGFTYNINFEDMYSGKYYIYAYGIDNEGNYTELTNSSISYTVDNSVRVYCPLVLQGDTPWCWAACATMLGKNISPNSEKDMEDVVNEVKGGLLLEGGTLEESAMGAEFACNYTAEFGVFGLLTEQQIEDLIDDGYAVLLMYTAPSTAPEGALGHTIVVVGYKTVLNNGESGVTQYFIYNDSSSTEKNKKYEDLYVSAEGRTYIGTVHAIY